MPGTVAPFPAHAPASNERDRQVWKVSLHRLREFGSILNTCSRATVHYMELQ